MVNVLMPPPRPLVSVVIPVRDRRDLIGRAVRSALPLGAPVEVVVVDDGSMDGSDAAAREVADTRVQVVCQAPGGVCRARNTGVAHARADWLLFLDSDDVLLEGWYDAVRPLIAEPGVRLVLASALYRVAGRWVSCPAGGIDPSGGARGIGLMPGNFVVRKDLMEHVGGFDEALTYAEHTELCLRLARVLGCATDEIRRTSAVLMRYTPADSGRDLRTMPAREAAALRLLEQHPQAFERSPDIAAIQWRIIARSRFLRGARVDGLRALGRAWRSAPAHPANLRSIVTVAVRGVWRRRVVTQAYVP